MAYPFTFVPIDENAQRFMCSLVDLPLIFPMRPTIAKLLNEPAILHKIIGDGNCLFRALSYIITGRQVYHNVVRHKILDHTSSIENLLLPHIGMSLNDYFQSSGMHQQGVWGTDIEIFAACSLLTTDIYVYTNTGAHYSWTKFSRSMLDNSPPQNMCSIYIQHTSGVHYDVVLDVNSGISHSSFMYKDIKDIHDVGMTKNLHKNNPLNKVNAQTIQHLP